MTCSSHSQVILSKLVAQYTFVSNRIMDNGPKDQELNYIKIDQASFLSDKSSCCSWRQEEYSRGTRRLTSCLFKQFPSIASGFSHLSCWIHRSENRNMISAVYWMVQQDRSCSHTMKFVSLLWPAPPCYFPCIDYALEVGHARTHTQTGFGVFMPRNVILPAWCTLNIQLKSNQ